MSKTNKQKWTFNKFKKLYELPFADLLYKAHRIHRKNFDPNAVQVSTLLSIKTGACPEDCAYCAQSARYKTNITNEKLLDQNVILSTAQKAKDSGATRFCMAGGWRNPKSKDLQYIISLIKTIKEMGLETCGTFGLLTKEQAIALKEGGLDYYNHNLDTSPEFYPKIITTRNYQDRLDTLQHVRNAGIKVCCGGILGLGENRNNRINLLIALANQQPNPPESVPINLLLKMKGTPLENAADLDVFEFVRTVAIARISMPKSFVRLSAGRKNMSDEMHSLCFFAGANSIHYGEKLLVTPNPPINQDQLLFERLGIKIIKFDQLEKT